MLHLVTKQNIIRSTSIEIKIASETCFISPEIKFTAVDGKSDRVIVVGKSIQMSLSEHKVKFTNKYSDMRYSNLLRQKKWRRLKNV